MSDPLAPAMSVSEAVRTKRAVRSFRPDSVPDPIVEVILHAGRRAQSSKNSQPWTFILITERDTLAQLSTTGGFTGHLAGAAFAVALVAEPGHEFDLGQAAAQMQLVAWEHGVGSCIASLWDGDRARAILGVPEELQCNLAISFGFPAEAPQPARAGGRRPLSEVVRRERW